ncbi:related to SIR2 family histone deacetylase [Ramularia collo-cygni]|uniref:Related to SIR2 family histone deacetylase n=1 Tax=Ramularia collo-cygni TaxID=112498 RepID=A0A2D3UZD7_9PEZI|nr:related to SIR2 family histone deacetylase [Ramularia collo-cygni]CZT20858.1 related to SIR2 family histone deacetylase [Ramularia collo-cygni]
MAHNGVATCAIRDASELSSFHRCLEQSTSIVALIGAGLSAPSGLSTFSSPEGIWTTYDAHSLATPEAFDIHPHRVWQFYARRRYEALQAHPNAGHVALAEASKRIPGLITLSQNVDGLCERAGHPPKQLVSLHGTLFESQCSNRKGCGYLRDDFIDAFTSTPAAAGSRMENQWSDGELDLAHTTSKMPACPQCGRLLRPGVVWYGEMLNDDTLSRIRQTFSKPEGIDVMLVIGTSAEVYPAAGYINVARARGARLCIVNIDTTLRLRAELREGDWFFEGDASRILPMLMEPLITNAYDHTAGGMRD